jgi:quercetin dioxygenase-like cupin family protein
MPGSVAGGGSAAGHSFTAERAVCAILNSQHSDLRPPEVRMHPDPTLFIANVLERIDAVPPDSILSRTVYADADVRVTLFGFSPSQELTEHTAARPAIVHILRGEGSIQLGDEKHKVGPGAWIHMAAELPHSVFAESELFMLLYLLK